MPESQSVGGSVLVPRSNQLRAIRKFLLPEKTPKQRKIVLCGTGGGKTAIALILAQRWLDLKTFKYVIYTTPKRQLRKQVRAEYPATRSFALPADFGAPETRFFPEVLECKSESLMRNYLQAPGGKVAVATGNVVLLAEKYLRPMLAEGRIKASEILFILDEGHHVHDMDEASCEDEDLDQQEVACANILSKLIRDLLRDGAHILKLTGTAYRGDGLPVYNTNDYDYDVTTVMELMVAKLAPSNLTSVVRRIPIDNFYQRAAKAVCKEFLADGSPPGITRLKPGDGDRNKEVIGWLEDAFKGAGIATVNGYGKDSSALEEALKLEVEERQAARKEGRQARYGTLSRMILGVHRVIEGLDSPARCCGYMIGIPNSFGVIAQFIGRLLRLRVDLEAGRRPLYDDYPHEWIDRSKIVFFIADVSDADKRHCETILKTCLYLDAFANADLIRELFSVDDGIVNPSPGSRQKETPNYGDVINHVLNHYPKGLDGGPSPSEVLTCFRTFWSNNAGVYSEDNLKPHAMARLAQRYGREFMDVEVHDKELLRLCALEYARGNVPFRKRLREKVWQYLDDGETPASALQRALESVFDEFQDATLVGNNTHLLNGDIIEDYARKIVRKAQDRERDKPQTTDEILGRTLAFREKFERWPDIKIDGDYDPNSSEWSYHGYHSLLRQGDGVTRLPGGLPQLLCQHRPWSWTQVEEDLADLKRDDTIEEYENRRGPRPEVYQRRYKDNLILRYYPNAVTVFRWVPRIVRLLSPEEAEAFGRAMSTKKLAAKAEQIFDRQGIEEIRRLLETETLCDIGGTP